MIRLSEKEIDRERETHHSLHMLVACYLATVVLFVCKCINGHLCISYAKCVCVCIPDKTEEKTTSKWKQNLCDNHMLISNQRSATPPAAINKLNYVSMCAL